MVAHNKNYKSAAKPLSKPDRNPRCAEPKDEVSHLHESDLICELADPSNSLEDICVAQGISLEALSLWMARPDVAERLDLVQTTAMNRARFIGRLTLPTAAQSAANIINAHKLRPQKPTIDSAFNTELHRANETMLKAARFLQRLTSDSLQKPPPRGERGQGVGEVRSESRNTQPSTPTTFSSTQSPPTATASTTNAVRAQTDHPSTGSSISQRRPKPVRSSRSRRSAAIRTTKARRRTPDPTPTYSRINAPHASKPSASANVSHPQNTPSQNARSPENSTAPPRALAPSQSPPPRSRSD